MLSHGAESGFIVQFHYFRTCSAIRWKLCENEVFSAGIARRSRQQSGASWRRRRGRKLRRGARRRRRRRIVSFHISSLYFTISARFGYSNMFNAVISSHWERNPANSEDSLDIEKTVRCATDSLQCPSRQLRAPRPRRSRSGRRRSRRCGSSYFSKVTVVSQHCGPQQFFWCLCFWSHAMYDETPEQPADWKS